MSDLPELPDLPAPDVTDLEGYYDKFYLHDAGEIRHHLQRLAGERSTLSVRPDNTASALPTILLKVDAAGLLIDVPASRSVQDAWLAVPLLRFEGSIDRAALRFSCGPAQLDTFEDAAAFRLPIPERVLYLQRREFMRREPPAGTLFCRLRLDEGEREVDATIRDIGGGGLAVITTRSQVRLQVGDVLRDCRIDLPELGEVGVDLQVRHVIRRGHLGPDATQAGCEFVNLTPVAQRKLFRYLLQLDRDLLARRRRLE
ncbi:MAG: flagellar brake protein [Xanthomonadales bacterium]|nr:flagellar brake protein [Xanthomonadales bacterium]MBN8794543.1 flagellar brake protein [Stenotrophomonas nitritireducens]